MREQTLVRLEDIEEVKAIEGRVSSLVKVDRGYDVTLGAYHCKFFLPEVEEPLGTEESAIRNAGRIKIYSEDLEHEALPASTIDDEQTRLARAGCVATGFGFSSSAVYIRAKGYEVFFPSGENAYRHAEKDTFSIINTIQE